MDIESSYIGTWNGTLPEGGETQMPNTLEEFAGTVGVTVGELIFAMLREGAIGGAVLAVIAFLLSRFTREIYGRALLALFLITAGCGILRLCRSGGCGSDMDAGRVSGGHCFRHYGLARSAWFPVVACCRMGVASPLGCSSSPK